MVRPGQGNCEEDGCSPSVRWDCMAEGQVQVQQSGCGVERENPARLLCKPTNNPASLCSTALHTGHINWSYPLFHQNDQLLFCGRQHFLFWDFLSQPKNWDLQKFIWAVAQMIQNLITRIICIPISSEYYVRPVFMSFLQDASIVSASVHQFENWDSKIFFYLPSWYFCTRRPLRSHPQLQPNLTDRMHFS